MIIHALHSFYGNDNAPGGRSKQIAESPARGDALHAYALKRGERFESVAGGEVVVERAVDSMWERVVRAAAVRLLFSPPARRRFSVSQFDRLVARRVKRLERDDVQLLHVWNDLPLTISALKERFPAARVVRDVAIAREFDFETGVPVQEEDRRVDVFFSPSAYVTEQLEKWGVDSSKIREIPFGVDCRTFQPKTDKPDKPLRFAFVGAVSKRKGIPTLLSVWKRLNLANAELHLYGTVKPEVEAMLSDARGVYTHGRTTVADKLPDNHVFVFPTTREGSAKAVYEALACGLPAVTTPNSGSVVRHGVDGLIVPPEDEDALAEAMQSLHEDAALREKMATHARARAEEYPWERYAQTVWDTYNELLEPRTNAEKVDR